MPLGLEPVGSDRTRGSAGGLNGGRPLVRRRPAAEELPPHGVLDGAVRWLSRSKHRRRFTWNVLHTLRPEGTASAPTGRRERVSRGTCPDARPPRRLPRVRPAVAGPRSSIQGAAPVSSAG